MMLPTLGWLKAETSSESELPENAPLHVSIDSRKIQPGETFWALSGTRDGHEFVEQAIRAGAAAAVVKRSFSAGDPDIDSKLIAVDDPMCALTELARRWRQALKCRALGLTGSVGKTTTKDFTLAAFANEQGVFATHGNFNNEIGVPLTILRTPRDAALLICEMGAARIGDIAHLCSVALPDSGLVTAIADAHTESFGSIENVMRGKGELYDFVARRGTAFVPTEDMRCVQASTACTKKIGYGFHSQPNDWESGYVQGKELLFDDEACANFVALGERIKLCVPGRPAAKAALAAMTIALHHGIAPHVAAQNISAARPASGRASVKKAGDVTIIDDSYNANPASMRAALETLSLRRAGRKVVILGDMLELGEISDIAHREVVEELDHAGVSLAVLIGPRMSHVAAASIVMTQLRIYPTVEQALPTLSQLVKPGDLVLVKASRGMALDRAVKRIEEQFS
ncbi:MAG: UDP-N-acetylmuramoyl-tripeptide--D-alanyl-D-alanine ligase [Calditrichaeota bacterium]|nr:UDP-N-acetylmuramoyl-tripeptide--D-alanyl-D-alanine ligase [Calditrichota bacterium]